MLGNDEHPGKPRSEYVAAELRSDLTAGRLRQPPTQVNVRCEKHLRGKLRSDCCRIFLDFLQTSAGLFRKVDSLAQIT
jgi:hypothetical protein